MVWTRKALIKAYIDFFKSKNHKQIENAGLIPENDPTVLFTTAGMHPLVPYILGQKHTQSKRLVNVQKCIRTVDIDEVGNTFHHTFFEMLGNWSLGDYFKEEAIQYSFEFLTKVLKISKENLAVSCFEGEKRIPKDSEAAEIWKSLGIKEERIAFLPRKNNWWGPAGLTGPCGPDTEMFYWTGKGKPRGNPKTNESEWREIWNDVFMQYIKDEKGNYPQAKQKNVDTGMGVERTITILNGLEDNYLSDAFLPIIKQIEKLSNKKYGKDEKETRTMRIIADHIKASVFILAEKIYPSNTEQGYVLRRLIRRAIRYGKTLMMQNNFTKQIAEVVISIYPDYSELEKNKEFILQEIEKEENRFRQTLASGLRFAEKIFSQKTPINKEKFAKLMQDPNKKNIISGVFKRKSENKDYSIKNPKISEQEIDKASLSGKDIFLLYQSYGFPLELIDELAMSTGLLFSHAEFRKELEKHQELSRTATQGKFKSGLADHSQETTKLHTATHLLNQALREVLHKKDIYQKGSNITAERLRFDFNFDRKLTDSELKEIENLVNKKIKEKLPVKCQEMSLEQAKKLGAQGVFESKYGEKVKVYSISDFSVEICAGPHIKNTGELGKFKIIKEESIAAGARRIKAILE